MFGTTWSVFLKTRPTRKRHMMKTKGNTEKVAWSGKIGSIQPRIRLMRSFDQRSHSYLGYVLGVEGKIGGAPGEFQIALGKAAQAKHRFCAGVEASGQAVSVPDPHLETAGYYKASGLKILKDPGDNPAAGPPFQGVPPDLETYRSRGIGVWIPELMTRNARPASGVAGCRWR
jgi:hypothetical protein